MTVVGVGSSEPQIRTDGSAPPARAIAAASRASSSVALAPLSATSHPSGLSKGSDQPRQLGQRRHRASGDHIGATELPSDVALFGTTASHGHVEFEGVHDLGQPVDPSRHGFEQHDGQIRPGDGQWNAGKTGA